MLTVIIYLSDVYFTIRKADNARSSLIHPDFEEYLFIWSKLGFKMKSARQAQECSSSHMANRE